VRVARHRRRSHDNHHHINGPAVDDPDSRAGTDHDYSGDRAPELVLDDDQHHVAAHDEHNSRRYDDIGMKAGLG
jgi:hypothetical protein